MKSIAERAGLFLITKEELQFLELGRQYLLRKEAEEKFAALESALNSEVQR
jgi:hypothetical protein